MEAAEAATELPMPSVHDASQQVQNGPRPSQTESAADAAAESHPESSAAEITNINKGNTSHSGKLPEASCRRYSREAVLALKDSLHCQKPPDDWDLNQTGELFQPAAHSQGRGPDHLLHDLQQQDLRRGLGQWGPGLQAPGLRTEGPIRSRLVENGDLADGPPPNLRASRQGSAPGARPWGPLKDDLEQDPAAGHSKARVMARKEPGPPDRWHSGQAPGGDSWRGPSGPQGRSQGLPGPQGRGQGPDHRERQWGGRPQQPTPPARPVDMPRASSQPVDRDAQQARSLEKDWRAGKGKGPPPSPSSREWSDSYYPQHPEGHMPSSGSLEQPDRHKLERQRHGGKGNPEWMGNNNDAVSAEVGGLSAGARKAQQFEAERQRMKEEWKKQQGQPRDPAHQPVSMIEFMTDDDLEALKAESNAEAATNGQGLSSTSQNNISSGRQPSDSSLLTNFFGQSTSGSVEASQPDKAFDFRSLASAAGQTLPAMPPMPKGVATLEDLERHARLSGQGPPPGFAKPSLEALAQRTASRAAQSSAAANRQSAATAMTSHSTAAVAEPSSSGEDANGTVLQQGTDQDSGKALLGLLSKTAADASSSQQATVQLPPTAITPPPGFPPLNRVQAASTSSEPPSSTAQAAISSSQNAAGQHGPISWGSSGLQGIWGAPAPSSGGTQTLWGAPLSLTPHAHSSSALQTPFATEQPTARPADQPETSYTTFMQPGRSAFGSLPEQPGTAKSSDPNSAGALGLDKSANSATVPSELNPRREDLASQVSNPLLALLGQHRSAPAEGAKPQHDPQLQAFLLAQSGHYSWHPSQAAHKPQAYAQQLQQQQQHIPQPAVHTPNEALSHDLLKQLQLGQSRLQAQHQLNSLQTPHAALNAYPQAAPAFMQSRPGTAYNAHDQLRLQAASQFGQQHQVPLNFGNALSRQAYGQLPVQTLGNPYVQQHQLPGQTYSHPAVGMQGNAHLAHLDGHRFGNYPTTGQQTYSNSDLSQLLLQRLQQQQQQQHQQHQQQQHQQTFSQSAQRGTGLDRFFNPAAFSSVQNPRVPTAQASVSELEAMMARQ